MCKVKNTCFEERKHTGTFTKFVSRMPLNPDKVIGAERPELQALVFADWNRLFQTVVDDLRPKYHQSHRSPRHCCLPEHPAGDTCATSCNIPEKGGSLIL